VLVLSRKAGEAIVLAGNITVYVLGIEHDRVKLGVEAPPDVLVLRSELVYDQYPAEQERPTQPPAPPQAEPEPRVVAMRTLRGVPRESADSLPEES
jgi:carbon storage regulator